MPFRRALILLALFTGVAHAAAVDRVVRRFDFEERAAGNVEDVPMDWAKVEGPGLPHYVNGALTTDQAFAGQYSFGLKLNGGSLLYRYPAGRIAVHAGAHYRVRVMAKTQGLVNARARLTAYCADAAGAPIKSSVTRSTPLASDEWAELGVDVTAPDDAAWLVVELGLLQSSVWRPNVLGSAALFEQDIDGRAWFDELTVAQVPQIRLGTPAPGNVFRRSDAAVIDVELNDRLTADLFGRLDVRDAAGRVVYQRSGDFDLRRQGRVSAARLVLPTLPAGWYRANLAFESSGLEVGRQSVSFVQLADDAAAIEPDARFGVIATGEPFEAWDDLPRLLPLLGVSRVKLGVWTAAGDAEHAPDFERFVVRLREAGIAPTACLLAPPPTVASKIGGTEWAKLVKADPDAWQPALAGMMSRYAGHLDRWQFGGDDRATDFTTSASLRQAYATVLRPMNELFHPADLAMPWPIFADLPSPAPAAVALGVPTDVLPQHVPLYVEGVHGPTVSLTLNALTADQYGRAVQMRDLAQRIGYAMVSKAPRIDLPLPFSTRPDSPAIHEPADTFLVERTLLTTLAGATYKGSMPISEDVEALLFDKGGEGVLLAWTKSPQSAGKTVPVMLGRSPRVVDLDGNMSAVLKPKAGDGTTDVVFGPTPTLLIGIDGPLAQLRTSFAFDNSLLESAKKPHVRRLRFANPYPSAISGRLKITGPAGWAITPQVPTFAVAAGGNYDEAVTIEFPFSTTSGVKPVDIAVELDSGPAFKVPLTLRLGLSDLGMDSSAFRDGADVVVQQMITNYGTRPANYTAYAAYPGAARQERLVIKLAPGATVIKRYRFTNVDAGGKKAVRSGVREIDGTRMLTDEVALP